MNRILPGIIVLLLGAGLAHAEVTAPSAPLLLAQSPTGNSNNPYNSPIRRANPNSMQGTQPNAPAVRGIQTGPTTRTPTLENGGIGNSYPKRDAAPSRSTTETKAPTYDANGNRR